MQGNVEPAALCLSSHSLGLRNNGNTCYLNSGVQAVVNLSQIKNLFLYHPQYKEVLIEKWKQSANVSKSESESESDSETPDDPPQKPLSKEEQIEQDKKRKLKLQKAMQERRKKERLKMDLLFMSCGELLWKYNNQTLSIDILKFVQQFFLMYPRFGGYTQQVLFQIELFFVNV